MKTIAHAERERFLRCCAGEARRTGRSSVANQLFANQTVSEPDLTTLASAGFECPPDGSDVGAWPFRAIPRKLSPGR